eukprot:3523084-Pleurochrysis_carterae.AAC.1
MPLVEGADLHETASGDPTGLRFNRPYRANPTGLQVILSKPNYIQNKGTAMRCLRTTLRPFSTGRLHRSC